MSDKPFEYTHALAAHYNGRHFRSRLESRWAAFFDSLGVEYQYEPDGFLMPSGDRYQPDFFLPTVFLRRGKPGVYIEVKPTYEAMMASHLTLSEFGSGHRDFVYGTDEMPPWLESHPGEHNLVILVGNVAAVPPFGSYGHFQYGPWWDDGMGFQRCKNCRATEIEFVGAYWDCPRCGVDMACTAQHPDLKEAERAARSLHFDRQGRAQS